MTATDHAVVLHDIRLGHSPELPAILGVPDEAKGLVIFAHGSGSGRLSPRNNHVARMLRQAGLATLLPDLLTPGEDEAGKSLAFDIPLLAQRLRMATDWAEQNEDTGALRPCYFGASTGGAAALRAAAGDPRIVAVVSRGGRPDLAGAGALARVRAPTMLIVGELDGPVIELNSHAYDQLRCEKDLAIVPGAGHLFEEPGTLEIVERLARHWLLCHLGAIPC